MSRLNAWLDQSAHVVEAMLKEHSGSTSHALAYVDLMKRLQNVRRAVENNDIERAVLWTSAFALALQKHECSLQTMELRESIEDGIEEATSECPRPRSALAGAHTPREHVRRLARALWQSGEYKEPRDAARETLKRAGNNPGEFGPKESLPTLDAVCSNLSYWTNGKK